MDGVRWFVRREHAAIDLIVPNRRSIAGRFLGAIFVQDGRQDEEERQEPHHVKGVAPYIVLLCEEESEAIDSQDEERQGKEKEQTIVGIAPKAQEKKPRHGEGHAHRAQ
jgi:hypothetical protein